MKRYALPAAVLALLLGVTAITAAYAQNNGRFLQQRGAASLRGMLRPGAFLAGLNLTEQQREQVRNILAGHKEEIQALVRETREAQRAFREGLAAGKDPAALKPAYDRASEARWNMLLLRNRIAAEIRQILTPEQQEKLERRIRRIKGAGPGPMEDLR
jgi:Spy/CpxP family protein refolding chaperone